MRAVKNQPWNNNPTYVEASNEVDWNMWAIRKWPFNDLEQGDTVYLMSGDGAGGSLITWEVEILKVLAEPYATKREAWDLIAAAFPGLPAGGFTRRQFLSQDYTKDVHDSGYLLAYNYDPVRRIGVPRPADLKIRRHGWGPLDDYTDAELRRWGLLSKSTPVDRTDDRFRPPPRRADPLKRNAVEARAMAVAKTELVKRGWKAHEITDTSAGRPYDFECTRGNKTLRVEVKGLSGPLSGVNLTRREVEHARTATAKLMLVVVHDIKVSPAANGTFKGFGGTTVVFEPWQIDDGYLNASAYDYALPPLP